MDHIVAAQEHPGSPQHLNSTPRTDDASLPESNSAHESSTSEEHITNGDSHPESPTTQGDEDKPSLSQGRALSVDTEARHEGNASGGTEQATADSERGDADESTLVRSPSVTTNGHASLDNIGPTSAKASTRQPNSSPLPPIPIEKFKPANDRQDHVPRTPTTPVSANLHRRSLTLSKGHTVSVVLISTALKTIIDSREAKRSAELRDSATHALEMVSAGQGGDRPREVFEPLRLACETRSEKLMIASLDCISKLISYSFFAESSDTSSNTPPPTPGDADGPPPQPSLVDLVAHTITACHTEVTPETVSLQIVKALLSLVLSPVVLVHQSSLLKAVRTVYNVFLLSTDPVNQMVAQGGLTQMVHHVFTRCQGGSSDDPADVTSVFRAAASEASIAASSRRGSLAPSQSETSSSVREATAASHREVQAVLSTMNDSTASLPAHHDEPGMLNHPNGRDSTHSSLGSGHPGVERNSGRGTQHDLFVKDAFLVFRALCKLTMKALNTESERDLKSHAMRSKLLSLHLVLTVLNSHMPLFVDPTAIIYSSSSNEATTFVQAINQYLCLSLSRNAVSPVPQVFEISVEIFWRVLAGMRTKLKKEIEVLLHEIFIPILEMRTSTLKQKAVILGMLSRLCQDPQALVEIYINYDCDSEAVDNIYEHLMNIISKIGTLPHSPAQRASEPTSPALLPTKDRHHNGPPALSTYTLSVSGSMDTSTMGLSESQLKRQGLECLVGVLRSLVAWGISSSGKAPNEPAEPAAHGEDFGRDTATPDTSAGRTSLAIESVEVLRQSTPDVVDDASRFESAKQKKTILVEGVKKFNFSPKRGMQFFIESGFIPSNDPPVIAEFLLTTDGLSKAMIGEYLSDTDKHIRDVMHAFVAKLNFQDPMFIETILAEGIKKFNVKPKRGIQFLIDVGFIPSNDPPVISQFLLKSEDLSKAMVGEYLGEADEHNVAVMHAFIDQLDFKDMTFLQALRALLAAFRLPGESQKIDRIVLKFSERYIANNAQTPFANADCAYVLSYSTIMLNTDQHSPQVKKRMDKDEFVRNNRGINDNANLPEELLHEIYDSIKTNEIRMKDEVDAEILANANAPPLPGLGIASALANVGRDLQKEAYVTQSNGMANKTEALFRTMVRSQRRGSSNNDQFFSASDFVHVKTMFEVAWMSFLAGLSGPLQETDDLEVVELCLDGFKNSIRLVCHFDLELARNAFVTTLAKFTFLNNLGEMKAKNMEAIKALLDIAVTEGNNLKGSWQEVLMCVSQLEHMQIITSGGSEASDAGAGRKTKGRKLPTEELANESRSTHITVAADMVFSLSHYLSGTAIVDFVQALTDVSWKEIQSSGMSQHPRLFSLQKLVEISYYNMSRIRLEWSNLWDILGEHFNRVCCHNNPHVGFFALDSLRQLAMRFLEKEELSHFKFQKDFLKPFEYTMTHNQNPDIRDMVLQCLQQMIQARVQNMRSGWRTMFGVFSAASKVLTERIANSAFEIVTRLHKDHFATIVRYGSFADLTVCITEFCKCSKYQKISLLAIAMLRGVIPVMLQCPECSLASDGAAGDAADDPMIRYWFPVLFGFYDIIMNGEDLEVRRLALDSLFSTLKTYGKTYTVEFWDTVCQELLFPIFAVLKSSQDLSRFSTQEDMSVWLSTTMIQALRDLIDLYTFHFDILERFLDGLLDLLCVCICQENDTLARIGTSCLQQLLEKNVTKLSPARWERVATTFVKLFRTTTPHQLFDETLRVEIDGTATELPDEPNGQAILPAPLSPSHDQAQPNAKASLSDRRRTFKQIIVKCVLQLLLIETTNDLLRNDEVYNTIPPDHLLRLMSVLDHSYQFAREFNEDKELRTGLWKVGFMKHLPNLLKQESSSAATLVHVLLRMYYDDRPEHEAARPQIAKQLMPLGLGVLQDYTKLKADTQAKNITAWTPVVAEILEGFCKFDEKSFARYLPAVYPLVTELLSRDMPPEIRQGVRLYFVRVGHAQGIMESS